MFLELKKNILLIATVLLIFGHSVKAVSATEGLSTQQEIQQLYLAYLGRPADEAGMIYWATQVDQGLISLDQFRINLVNEQPEYLANYGMLETQQLTEAVYRNLFNREPDQAGLNYWVNELNENRVLPDQLIVAFINGALASDQIVLKNKLTIAECFTNGAEGYNQATVSSLLSEAGSETIVPSCTVSNFPPGNNLTPGASTCSNSGPGSSPSSGSGTASDPYIISLGTSYGGCAVGEADPGPIYAISVPAGTYTVSQTNGTTDLELWIYDEDGNNLDVIDNFFGGSDESDTYTVDVGTYGIEVFSNTSDGPFTLRVY